MVRSMVRSSGGLARSDNAAGAWLGGSTNELEEPNAYYLAGAAFLTSRLALTRHQWRVRDSMAFEHRALRVTR